MARAQTLVQRDDHLLALLDQRSSASGISRSALIREAIEDYLARDAEAARDAAILAGYAKFPPAEPDALAMALAAASIEEEPS
jgi:metal-responsive CopG/Arc/MetJ family transcriptional regulator